ncbi:hypothetical protein Sm713_17280 [Streptomyces sp. TS71-3]|nr:hypothetical protein Sm713_17280 [Streptomyces sp. TS71-3]
MGGGTEQLAADADAATIDRGPQAVTSGRGSPDRTIATRSTWSSSARGRPVKVRRTLGLLCDAIREGLLTIPLVSALADDLLKSRYRLPFEPGGFAEWCDRERLF